MRRTNTQDGAKFTVRGQRYIQTGSFWHTMPSDREVRVLELKTDCPVCGDAFEVTASMRQIEARMLTRRCKRCRKIHRGPVRVPPIKPSKARGRRRMVLRGAKRRKAAAAPDPRIATAAKGAAASKRTIERQQAAPAATSPARPAAAPPGILPVMSAREDQFDAYSEILGLVD